MIRSYVFKFIYVEDFRDCHLESKLSKSINKIVILFDVNLLAYLYLR